MITVRVRPETLTHIRSLLAECNKLSVRVDREVEQARTPRKKIEVLLARQALFGARLTQLELVCRALIEDAVSESEAAAAEGEG